MTINKAQGQTLQRVGIYLDTPCFSHGQLYVAASASATTCASRSSFPISGPLRDDAPFAYRLEYASDKHSWRSANLAIRAAIACLTDAEPSHAPHHSVRSS